MKKLAAIWLLIGSSLFSYARTYMVQGYIGDLEDSEVYLSAFKSGGFMTIDSTRSAGGSFLFVLSDSNHPGLYALEVDTGRGSAEPDNRLRLQEFIFNYESVEIYASGLNELSGPGAVTGSMENALYFEYLETQELYRDSIQDAWLDYRAAKERGRGIRKARRKYVNLQEQLDDHLVVTAAAYPDLYVSRIMKAARFPVIDPRRGGWETAKHRFFEKAPMDDTLMLFHPLYTDRIRDFLSLFHQYSGTESLLPDEASYEAIDIIMANVSSDPRLRLFIAEYLLGIFEHAGHEPAQVYIVENYIDEQCESELLELVQLRMERYRAMQAGTRVPDFVIRDVNHQWHTLSEMDHDYILVVFWATSCEHCRKLIPKLHEWYLEERKPNLEVVAISIDTSRVQWEQFMQAHPQTWISAFEPLGWQGKVAEDYNIYATPSLFLLDRDRRIMAKPLSYREFLRNIRDL